MLTKENLREYDLEEPNLTVEFDHFVLTCSNESEFEDHLSNSYFLKNLIVTISNETCCKFHETLASAT